MNSSYKPGQQQPGGPTPGQAAPGSPHHNMAQLTPGQHTPSQENHIGNVTLFRTGNFFVHAVNRFNQQRTGMLHRASGNTSLLEQIRWVSAERQRVTEVGTRLLPHIEAINPVQAKEIPVPVWLEGIVVTLGLLLALARHVFHLFTYPFYQPDEGTYISNAWAITHGMLQPYSYTYTHPPLGWIQIAGWIQLTGGFFSFGNALNSGRVLMLLYMLGSSLLVYLITSRLSGSRSCALLAMIIFSLSPLGATYQREVLVDNIGTFWLLLSLFLMVVGESRLPYIVFAGISLGVAILSKESFLVFLPAMLYAAWLHATTFQRKFALVAFTYTAISVASSIVLLALLKGELFPTGFLPWDHHQHPSLLATLFQHAQYPFKTGSFSASWDAWKQNDLLLLIASSTAIGINLVIGWANRMYWLLALLAISFWAFLLLSDNVYPYTIVPLIPLMAINIAIAISTPLKWLCQHIGFDLVRVLLIFSLIGAFIPSTIQYTQPALAQNETLAQTNALSWIRNNVPHNAVVITNSYLYTDLHESSSLGAAFPSAHIYWNAALDPEIRGGLLHDDWNKIDYIMLDAQMLNDIKIPGGPMLLLDRALHHAILRVTCQTTTNNPDTTIQIYQIIHSTR
ncbi:MAG: glycosyltransferase family 39 protein [Ktedonobacteraceae bacterium]|nr:glycosyltransferase family 39 protein [Ktedonobacteraceae bacterium]